MIRYRGYTRRPIQITGPGGYAATIPAGPIDHPIPDADAWPSPARVDLDSDQPGFPQHRYVAGRGAAPAARSVTTRVIDAVRSKYPASNNAHAGTHLLAHNGEIYTAAGERVGRVPFGSASSASWIAPGRIYGLWGTRLMQYDVGGEHLELFNFADYGAAGTLALGAHESGPSRDDRLFVACRMAESDGRMLRAWVWERGRGLIADLSEGAILAAAGLEGEKVDAVVPSPTGRYLIATINTGDRAVMRFDADGRNPVKFGTAGRWRAQHATHTFMPDGAEVRVQVWSEGLALARIDDPGVIYALDGPGGHGHLSAAFQRPGYVVHAAANNRGGPIRGIALDWALWAGAREVDTAEFGRVLMSDTPPTVEPWGDVVYTVDKYPGPTPLVDPTGSRVLVNQRESDDFRMVLIG